MIIIACIIAFKTIFHDFKPEYLISWNAFSNWWIDTYVGLFKMILSIILGITLIWGIGWLIFVLCPRGRSRADRYGKLQEYLKENYHITLIIKSQKTK